MTDNPVVVGIRGAAPPIPQPNQLVIAVLESLLVQARDGHIQGIVYGTVDASRHLQTGWTGTADRHDMCAVANMLAFRVTQATVE